VGRSTLGCEPVRGQRGKVDAAFERLPQPGVVVLDRKSGNLGVWGGVYVFMYKSRFIFFGGLLLGVLLGFLGSSLPKLGRTGPSANSSYMPAQLQSAPFVVDGSRVVEVYIDPTGRVQDYRVLTGAQDLSSSEKNMLIFTTFRPATLRGRPVIGTAVPALPKGSAAF
jgi:hypothetical protein